MKITSARRSNEWHIVYRIISNEVCILKRRLGKWEQNLLLQQNPLTALSIPETSLYSMGNLLELLNRYQYVYVKHDTSGQGRGVFKVYDDKDGHYCFNGFSIQGKPINECVTRIEDFHQVLNPFEKFGRCNTYIIQEGIQSFTQGGQPISIRVHVQKLKGQWIVGGMNGKIGVAALTDNGITNFHRGAQVTTIEELLAVYLKMTDPVRNKTIKSLEEVAIFAADVIASHYSCREYGIDFGLTPLGKPMLFEVNTTPGINGFATLENRDIWKRIVDIRKMQNEGNS